MQIYLFTGSGPIWVHLSEKNPHGTILRYYTAKQPYTWTLWQKSKLGNFYGQKTFLGYFFYLKCHLSYFRANSRTFVGLFKLEEKIRNFTNKRPMVPYRRKRNSTGSFIVFFFNIIHSKPFPYFLLIFLGLWYLGAFFSPSIVKTSSRRLLYPKPSSVALLRSYYILWIFGRTSVKRTIFFQHLSSLVRDVLDLTNLWRSSTSSKTLRGKFL